MKPGLHHNMPEREYMPSDVVSIDPRGRCFDWCAECCRCGECLLDLADDAADDLLTTHWKGEL